MVKIGEKIKTLRKELHMTQGELVGSEMTKSMLSQIENNISTPSMKTLQYIAARLNKPVSYFLDDDKLNVDENKQNSELEGVLREVNTLVDSDKLKEAQQKISNISTQIRFDKTLKLYNDTLFKLGDALIKISDYAAGKRYLDEAIDNYIEGKMFIEAAKAYVAEADWLYKEFKYEECLKIWDTASELYYKDINKDVLFEIELYYYKVMILSSLGETEECIEILTKAIDLSSKTSVYYKTDEFYRLMAIMCYFYRNSDEYKKNIQKAQQFAEFSENRTCLSRIHAVLALEALDLEDGNLAIEHAQKQKDYAGCQINLYYLVMGRAYLLLGDYKLAYENLLMIDYPDSVTHRYDYMLMWSSKVYLGLILNKFGKHEEAIKAIESGIDKMLRFEMSPFLVHAYKSLSEVYSEIKDFEKAFFWLKKADELKVEIDKSTKKRFY